MANNQDLDLEEQLAILGVDLGGGVSANPVQTTIPQPQMAENPTNAGVVTNSVVNNNSGLSVSNSQLASEADVVQTTVTRAVPQPQVTNTVQQAVNTVAKTTVPPAKPATAPANNDEVVFIDLARAVNTQKTPWLKLKDNEWSRVLILDLKKAIPIKVHYIKGLGFVKCLSTYTPEGWLDQPALCCKKRGPTGELIPRLDEDGNEIKAKSRFLVPVIEYPVDKSNANKLVPGQTPVLKMWNMNVVEWGDLLNAVKACADDPDDLSTADLTNVDFLLNKDTSSRFKTINISASPKCLRGNFEANIQAEIAKFTQEFYTTALKESRKIASEETIANSYAAQEAVNNAVNSVIENQSMGNQDLDI